MPGRGWGRGRAREFAVPAETTGREGCLAGSPGSLRFGFRADKLLRWIEQLASI